MRRSPKTDWWGLPPEPLTEDDREHWGEWQKEMCKPCCMKMVQTQAQKDVKPPCSLCGVNRAQISDAYCVPCIEKYLQT